MYVEINFKPLKIIRYLDKLFIYSCSYFWKQ